MGPVSGAAAGSAAARRWRSRLPLPPGRPARPRHGSSGASSALTVVYSLACITRLIPWERVSIGGHALAVSALQPLVAAACGSRAAPTPTSARCSCCRCSTSPTSSRPATLAAGRDRDRAPTRRRWSPPRARITCWSRRTLGLRRRLRRPGGHDPVPQAPPGRRRAPPAPDGPRGPADRPARTGARSTRRSTARSRAAALHAAARRRRLLQADQRPLRPHTGDRVLRELAAHTSAAVRARRLPGADRRRRVRARRPGRRRRGRPRLAAALREAGARVDARRRPGLAHGLGRRLSRRTAPTASAHARPRPRPARASRTPAAPPR